MSGRRRNSGTLPGRRRLTFESRTFPKFWPDTESFESRGERSRKDSVYRDYTNFAGAGEPGRFICLAQCSRTSGGRSQRSVSGKLVCRCIVVGLVFVVVLNFRLLPLSYLVVDASLSDEKRKKLLWTVELWRIVLMHYTPILFFFLWTMWRTHTTTEAVPRRLSTIPQIHNNKASTFPVLLLYDLFNELSGKGEVPAFAILTTYLLIDLIDIITPISHV